MLTKKDLMSAPLDKLRLAIDGDPEPDSRQRERLLYSVQKYEEAPDGMKRVIDKLPPLHQHQFALMFLPCPEAALIAAAEEAILARGFKMSANADVLDHATEARDFVNEVKNRYVTMMQQARESRRAEKREKINRFVDWKYANESDEKRQMLAKALMSLTQEEFDVFVTL